MNKNKLVAYPFFCFCVLASLLGCKNSSFDDSIDNKNKGTLEIYADESYKILLDELIQSYENVYPEAKITPVYVSDEDVLKALMETKTRMAFTGRNLSTEELNKLKAVNSKVLEQFIIGKEAIAVVTAKSNPDSVFYLNEFINSRNAGYSGKYTQTGFVFNKKNVGMINQLLGYENNNYNNMFSLDNADTLMSYIAANNQSIGFISFAEISDTDDPAARALLSSCKVLAVAKADSTGKLIVTELSQSTLMTNKYALLRNVTVIKGNTPELLGTGFVSFMYRSKASRIMLKAGLIPENMTERQINIVE